MSAGNVTAESISRLVDAVVVAGDEEAAVVGES